jgi:Uma2 family endonuclease
MITPAQRKMTVDEFLAWVEGQDGRWELYRGVPYPMGPERVRYGEVKFAVQAMLMQGIRRANLRCHMLPAGTTVRVSLQTAHKPDALAYCGPKLLDDSIEVPEPIIVVEVASPSTRRIDASLKLNGYFRLPSVHHYLIVDADAPPVIHHRRQGDGTILTTIVHDGVLTLAPPGSRWRWRTFSELREQPSALSWSGSATVHSSACSGVRRELDPWDEPEDDKMRSGLTFSGFWQRHRRL